ncbi:hypothetical protein C7M84_001178 [Penaeus vannamei]|uniref:Uncharacterized protein n=1 Tax=Penaeus vannamei TaxID=6689 RepID=A0A3R7SXK3_PENVA|nr:hypothetical protein C7M84_001178 [Penaeus vannamei]
MSSFISLQSRDPDRRIQSGQRGANNFGFAEENNCRTYQLAMVSCSFVSPASSRYSVRSFRLARLYDDCQYFFHFNFFSFFFLSSLTPFSLSLVNALFSSFLSALSPLLSLFPFPLSPLQLPPCPTSTALFPISPALHFASLLLSPFSALRILSFPPALPFRLSSFIFPASPSRSRFSPLCLASFPLSRASGALPLTPPLPSRSSSFRPPLPPHPFTRPRLPFNTAVLNLSPLVTPSPFPSSRPFPPLPSFPRTPRILPRFPSLYPFSLSPTHRLFPSPQSSPAFPLFPLLVPQCLPPHLPRLHPHPSGSLSSFPLSTSLVPFPPPLTTPSLYTLSPRSPPGFPLSPSFPRSLLFRYSLHSALPPLTAFPIPQPSLSSPLSRLSSHLPPSQPIPPVTLSPHLSALSRLPLSPHHLFRPLYLPTPLPSLSPSSPLPASLPPFRPFPSPPTPSLPSSASLLRPLEPPSPSPPLRRVLD